MENKATPKILVIYTGGTVGVKKVNNVYIPVKDYLPDFIRNTPTVYGRQTASIQSLSTFDLTNREGSHILYSILEWDTIKDSSNINAEDWKHMAKDIRRYYTVFDGFVILHGTDTMTYTASALSFMLDNLAKPVVITGAQIPIAEFRSDGENNMLGALAMASTRHDDGRVIAEVCIFFNNKLIRGNRSMKMSCSKLDAFDSPNFKPLATLEDNIEVNWNDVRQPVPGREFSIKANMTAKVTLLWMYPTITLDTVRANLRGDIKGVVLMTFGAGNVPSNRQDILSEIQNAVEGGKLIVNCTQVPHGKVEASYETGDAVLRAGVIPLSDITPEAALTKLNYVISNVTDMDRLLTRDLRGEMAEMHNQYDMEQLENRVRNLNF
ncbi:L-asparaginase-like [Diadema setosum]|uniref:L-asparaginase-like n=1 Tax=Diadema setosum TaxID=31175 RepID=UPI003B3A038C